MRIRLHRSSRPSFVTVIRSLPNDNQDALGFWAVQIELDLDRAARGPSDQIPTPSIYFCDPEVPAEAVAMGERIMAAGGLDVGGIEYLEATDGTRVFYDVNANSNLRAPIGQAFGFDPFERVVDYITEQIERNGASRTAAFKAAHLTSITAV
jgi:hypothetical protein